VHRKALVLDLDETLVHSSLKTPPSYHFKINVFVEYLWRDFYVIKRPALEEFLDFVGRNYQVYIFTAGVREYAEPVIEKIDTHKWVVGRFFRDSCVTRTGFFVKDLTNIRMDLSSSIIIDNQPVSYSLNKGTYIFYAFTTHCL
jgi:RNA polymerase II subunit A small phosphatase-like protein